MNAPQEMKASKDLAGALNTCLRDLMETDESVVILGGSALSAGGLYGVTQGLRARFGEDRVLEGPDDARVLLGTALGMAQAGLRPIVDLESADQLRSALDILSEDIAALRFTSGGQARAPITLRLPSGGGIGAGPFQSGNLEASLAAIPGLRVAAVGDPNTAAALLREAVHCDDPVALLEPKNAYRRDCEGDAADAALDTARRVASGDDVTLLSWGTTLNAAHQAVAQAGEHGIAVDFLDLVSLSPLDEEGILESVRRTGRCVIVEDAPRRAGLGAELSALIAERAIESLEAPVLRVAGWNIPRPHSRDEHYSPNSDRVMRAIEQVIDF